MTDSTRRPPAPKQTQTAADKLAGKKPLQMAIERPKSPGFDPYARVGMGAQSNNETGATSRRDLRKLSEWIKMKRDLEERRARGEFDASED